MMGKQEPAPPTGAEDNSLRTIAEAMRELACSASQIYRFHHRGELELVKMGRVTRVTTKSLRRLQAALPRLPRRGKP